MPGLKLITAPTVEPVTASEILTKIGVNSGDVSTTDLEALITGARQWAEEYTGRALINQTWELALDDLCESGIDLAKGTVQSITSIKYLDADGVEQTLASTEYLLDDYAVIARIVPAYGKTWPATRSIVNAVKVRYVAGYGAAATAVPVPVKNAIVLIVGQALRGQPGLETSLYPASIPNAAKEMLNPYRVMKAV